MPFLTEITILAVVLSAIFFTLVFSRMAYHRGLRDGFSNGAAHALQQRMQEVISGKRRLSVEDFEAHCHSTVTSELYGKPDWFSHVAFKYFGEAGEFAEHVGKASRDDGWSIFKGVSAMKVERRTALGKELGDGLWYIVMLARELGLTLSDVMRINIEKRDGRKQRGTMKGEGDDR